MAVVARWFVCSFHFPARVLTVSIPEEIFGDDGVCDQLLRLGVVRYPESRDHRDEEIFPGFGNQAKRVLLVAQFPGAHYS